MKRILSLDGGGIRGVFTLEILLRMQQLLRAHTGSPRGVLADHFDLFAGTSTGAIIATCLSWGMDVEDILALYVEHGRTMFQHVPWYRPVKRMFVSRYEARPLSALLQRIFSEDGDGAEPALLSTGRLKTLLLVVVRNHTTGSAWPITNNPRAKYNDPALPDCNLNVPLWKIVRASAAAPVFFDPEEIVLGGQKFVFVDGGITPYNNPALIAALTAILPAYNIGWEPGPEKIRLVSVGTIRVTSADLQRTARQMWLGYHLPRIPAALMQGVSQEQDYLCRCLGACLHGEELDSEIGNLIPLAVPGPRWFSYVRYNQSFLGDDAQKLLARSPGISKLDAVDAIPLLRETGRMYAERNVALEHLL
ncbi:MAG TPA: patatin-like phospholipase family protein [Terriglobia bacterium]|nr:patatin-like phospholipase family protein [Terriglobia bacterium]